MWECVSKVCFLCKPCDSEVLCVESCTHTQLNLIPRFLLKCSWTKPSVCKRGPVYNISALINRCTAGIQPSLNLYVSVHFRLSHFTLWSVFSRCDAWWKSASFLSSLCLHLSIPWSVSETSWVGFYFVHLAEVVVEGKEEEGTLFCSFILTELCRIVVKRVNNFYGYYKVENEIILFSKHQKWQ